MLYRESIRKTCRGFLVLGAITVLAVGGCGESPSFVGGGVEEESFDVPGEWSGRNALPEPLVATSAAVWNDQIHIVGGYSGTTSGPASRHVLRLDPSTLSIDRLTDLDAAVADAALVVYRDTLLLVGGNAGDRVNLSITDAVKWYDADTDTWHTWARLLDRRAQHTAQVVDDAVYVVGGKV